MTPDEWNVLIEQTYERPADFGERAASSLVEPVVC